MRVCVSALAGRFPVLVTSLSLPFSFTQVIGHNGDISESEGMNAVQMEGKRERE